MNTPEVTVRRVITFEVTSPGCCQGWLEDNFHHFGVTIRHDGERVLDVEGSTVRFPWTACAGATVPLRALIGTPLGERAETLSERYPVQLNCTHMFELAALTIAAAKRAQAWGRRELIVWTTGASSRKMEAVLLQDQSESLRITVEGNGITGPHPYTGHDLYRGFKSWLSEFPASEAERLWIMRRAFWLADGADKFIPKNVADETGLGFVCHTYQPENRHSATAKPNSRVDPNEPGKLMLGAKLPLVEPISIE